MPTPERVQKLAAIITHQPKEPNSHLNHISFAWPKSVLKDAQANCVGFLMPEIKEAKELINVYNYQKRKALKLDVDWRFLRRGLLLYAPNSLIQPVDRTIPLEIVHLEVLRCFNDGYKNSNLRSTAGDWVKALRLAVNELTICEKVDSHYYSRTDGKCYRRDRSNDLQSIRV
ncbi:MAG: hypothetical protein V7L20_20305 [Nostoc sp.]|uniref:hypothetical protein n=1 Tax=Nostoc sp. TaxID=1180 RepID=UPI002FF7E1AF